MAMGGDRAESVFVHGSGDARVQSRTTHPLTRFTHQLLCGFFLLLCVCSASRAQTVYRFVVGHVVDSTEAHVSSPNVPLTSLKKAEQRTTTTDSRGDYQFISLPLNSYQLEIASPGLKQLTMSSIDVTVGSVVRFDATLVVGGTSDSIEVRAQTALLQ